MPELDGLSPLARGTRGADYDFPIIYRFIPAGAGNTFRVESSSTHAPVYPRWRGEHHSGFFDALRDTGLSPLARGTHTLKHLDHLAARFIPAGAGNTLAPNFAPAINAVYPRWRGEHAERRRVVVLAAGLSPLARGTPLWNPLKGRLARFIPAGAGNTKGVRTRLVLDAVYPRWRGEHKGRTLAAPHDNGLSPLARGTRGAGRFRWCD